MTDDRTKFIALAVLLYGGAVVLLFYSLWVAWGFVPNKPWLTWLVGLTKTGIRSSVEAKILASIGGGLLLVALVPLYVLSFFPWRFDAYGGSKAAWARWADVWWLRFRYGVRFTRRLRPGKVLGKLHGRWVTVAAPLYVMLFGPAGEGKTAGVLIPSALNLPHDSLIVNDPAGEICEATIAHREALGPVYRLEWGSPRSHCFNPLARSNMPTDEVAVCDYIDTLAGILIPVKKGSDPTSSFFTNSARTALAAVMGYLFFLSAEGGKDTSVGETLSWLSMLGAEPELDDEGYEDPDPVGTDLKRASQHAEQMGFPRRVVEALNAFAQGNKKSRSDVLATITNDELMLWRNDYVRRATEQSDFALHDLDDPSGKPVTIYLVVPVADQERYGKATGLFLEAFYTYTTRGSVKRKRRPVTLILDELKFIPPLRLVKDGPSILRKFKVSGLLGFQDRAQVEDVYDKATLSGFDQNVIAKIIFTLSHLETAQWVSNTIGTRWSRKRTSQNSSQQGASVINNSSQGESTEAVPLVTPQDVMSLEKGRQLVLFRSIPHRPLYARSPFFFKTAPFKRLTKRRLTPRAQEILQIGAMS